jgi:hypothetical protein
MLEQGDWNEVYLVINVNNILDIYQDNTRSIRLDQVV